MKRIGSIIAGLVLLAVALWIVRTVCFQHSYAPSGPMTLQEFENNFPRGDRLPSSATNIYFAHSSVGMGGRAHIYKFAASWEDCVAHAQKDFLGYARQLYDRTEDYPPTDLVSIEGPHKKPDLSSYWLTKIEWFDVESVKNGFTIPCPRSHLPYILIDKDNNVLYSYWTD